MISIKEFLSSRCTCPICKEDLQIKVTCLGLSPIHISYGVKEEILSISSRYFNFEIDVINNIIVEGKDNSHFEFHLSLFCPFHTDLEAERYEYDLIFDVYNGKLANESPHEILKTKDFMLSSLPYLNQMEYTNLKTNAYATFPYFDYSHMSLSKLNDKLKTYLLMQ